MGGKARIHTFGFDDAERARIDARFESLGIPPVVVMRRTQGSVRLQQILEQDAEGEGRLEVDERVVLFHNISDAGVVRLMQLFREIDVPRPIFATVTESNLTFTLAELLEHLVEERAQMQGRGFRGDG